MMKRRLDAIRNIGQVMLLLVLAGCVAPSAAVAPAQSAPPSATPAATTDAPTPVPGNAAADQLYVTGADASGLSRLFVLNGASGKAERTLPRGYIAPDWSILYQVAPVQNTTTIRAYDIATGRLLREMTLDGLYDAPVSADTPWQSAFSPDGRWLVLFQQSTQAEQQKWHESGQPRTRILVLDTSLSTPPRRIDLEGNFWFDALSVKGASLYLIQVLDPGWPPEYSPGQSPHYQVRRYDMATARLDEQPVVDKSEVDPMIGNRYVSVATRGGAWLYSLYTRLDEGPFVHALNLNDRYAVCVDLPFPVGGGDFESDLMWSLALAPDESTLYAVNVALGQVAAINTQTFAVRSATLPRPNAQVPDLLARISRWLMPAAEAKRLVVGGAAVSPDGQMLYALDSSGLVAIATSDLSLRGRFLADWTLNSLALGSRGDALYAVSDEKGAILRLALPAAGSSAVQVDSPARPVAVLRVSSER